MSFSSILQAVQKSTLSDDQLRLLLNLLAEQIASSIDSLIIDEEGYSMSETLLPLVRAAIDRFVALPSDILDS